MAFRRDLLQILAASAGIGIAGCNTFIDSGSNRDAPQERTDTTVLTPTSTTATETNIPTESPTETPHDTETATATPTRTPTPTPRTIAEKIGTAVYRPTNDVDEFGQAVTLSTDTAIVVAEEHGAYVFEDDGDGEWTHTTVLLPTDHEDFGGHDVSAALVGNRVMIGGPEAGAVYLFERGDDGWTQRHRFNPDNTEAGEFGRSVAFDGDRVVVGDANEPTTMVSYVGGAYVFASDDGDWTREASFTTDTEDLFGTSVAIDSETILVGAPFAELGDNTTGAVYAYELVDQAWERRAVLSPADPTEADDSQFGQAVALDGDTAVVGAPEILRGPGRAYVFERTNTGWDQMARLTTPDIDEGAEFGCSVGFDGETVVVGALQAHETGRAYVFRASDDWTDPLRLAAADPHEDAEFGAAVALSDTTALVGAPVFRATSGAYLFDL